jgi:myo-inositol-1(or 4)-monophosphatase
MNCDTDLLRILTDSLRQAAPLVSHPDHRFTTDDELFASLAANDNAVTDSVRPKLLEALPGSQWTSEEHGEGPMPAGDWWVVDPVGGNLNALQGMPDWNIGVSLVRDGRPVLAALFAPIADELFTAIAGDGASLNGTALAVSAKTDLHLALTGTGQARPISDPAELDLRSRAIGAMMTRALAVRQSIPVGQHLTYVAAGRTDVHWQFENLRSHIAPVLIAHEAGATVTDLDGADWSIESHGYLAAAPGVHAAALDVLRSVR